MSPPQSTKGGFGGGGSVRRNSFGEARPSAPSAAKRFAKVTPQEFAARRWIDAFQVRARTAQEAGLFAGLQGWTNL